MQRQHRARCSVPDSPDEPQSKVPDLLASARREALRGRHGAAWEDLHGDYALGSTEAAYAITTWYLHGEHVETDLVLGIRFLDEAAGAGWADALSDLAVCYELGRGKAMDLQKARDLYECAALSGDHTASFEVARLMETLDPNEAGRREAFVWYLRAAESGDAEAQYAVGWAYEYGNGTDKNLHAAIEWYRRAAEQDHEDALGALLDLDSTL